MDPKGSLPHSQVPTTCLYPESAQSSPYRHIPLLIVGLKHYCIEMFGQYEVFVCWFFTTDGDIVTVEMCSIS
jgi:hypothetical protein